MMGESTGGREGEETWLGQQAFLSGHRKTAGAPGPGSDLTRTAQFCSLEITHLPPPSYSFSARWLVQGHSLAPEE